MALNWLWQPKQPCLSAGCSCFRVRQQRFRWRWSTHGGSPPAAIISNFCPNPCIRNPCWKKSKILSLLLLSLQPVTVFSVLQRTLPVRDDISLSDSEDQGVLKPHRTPYLATRSNATTDVPTAYLC